MLITKFCEIYGVDKGEVDYWTRIGLLHPRELENGYRDYSGQAEEEILMISVARMLDYPGSLESKIEKLYAIDDQEWNRIVERLENKHNRFTRVFNAAHQFAINKADKR